MEGEGELGRQLLGDVGGLALGAVPVARLRGGVGQLGVHQALLLDPGLVQLDALLHRLRHAQPPLVPQRALLTGLEVDAAEQLAHDLLVLFVVERLVLDAVAPSVVDVAEEERLLLLVQGGLLGLVELVQAFGGEEGWGDGEQGC